MKSAYQLDREMNIAWLRWTKAQTAAWLAKAEYDKAAEAMKNRLKEDETKQGDYKNGIR